MPLCLAAFQAELEALKNQDLIRPDGKLEQGEQIVGCDVDPDLKKLFTLWRRYEKQYRQMVSELGPTPPEDKEELYAIIVPILRLKRKADILEAAFWFEVRERHDLWDKPSVGIVKGWRITCNDRPPSPSEVLVGISIPAGIFG